MWRRWVVGLALAAGSNWGTLASAQPATSFDATLSKNWPGDRQRLVAGGCPDGAAIGWKSGLGLVCAPTPAPTATPGGGGSGGTCTPEVLTRSSATVYTFAGTPGTVSWVSVSGVLNRKVGSCGGLNDYTLSGGTVTFCYSVNVSYEVVGCGF